MKQICFEHLFLRAALTLLLLTTIILPAAGVVRRDKKAPATDSIDVIGHLALTNASIANLKTSEHWRREFLELQDSTHGTLTLVDVTDATHPALVKELRLPTEAANSSLSVLVGDVALLTGTDTRPADAHVNSVSVVSFVDSDHPKTVRKFDNVSALRIDQERGLIYLVNGDRPLDSSAKAGSGQRTRGSVCKLRSVQPLSFGHRNASTLEHVGRRGATRSARRTRCNFHLFARVLF